MKLWLKQNYKYLLFSLIITIIFAYPFLIKDFLPLEHDTLFHLSRIEGLAQSFKDGVFLPRIYPYKNMNFGYGSPMFYSDFFLIIPALLYNLGISVSVCYVFIIMVFTFLSSYFAMKLCRVVTNNNYSPYIAGTLYLFSNYRITDVYVRSSLGEVMGFAFLPLVLLGIYYVLYTDTKKWYYLAIGFTCLALTHNITFVLACILFIFFLIVRIKHWIHSKEIIIAIFKAFIVSLGCSAFFIFPMLEQMTSQNFYLSYYTSTSSLADSSVELWKYFANTTVFGYGTHGYAKDMSMLLNPGYFMMIIPIVYLFRKKENKNPFILHSLILGYIFLLLPLDIFPWEYMVFFGLIQFTWRLIMLATCCLIIPASIALFDFKIKPLLITIVCCVLLIGEGVWHIYPVLTRTTGINYDTSYESLIDGSIIDPFYSAFYVRVELAGADYLPEGSPDYRELSNEVTDSLGNSVSSSLTREGTNLLIENIKPNQSYILPITYYLGYQVYALDAQGEIIDKVSTYKANNTLVGFNANDATTYLCRYDETPIQKYSLYVSLVTGITILFLLIKKKMNR
ncbi:hypothetical protein [Anaerorhabdus sp.]|uniref:hypothetical protein n=1 Tax=Anaerorhabdus sp. TaxID=1872524 RepID=UPI002B200EC2|nr:hypothetical protein [Anaerorhabdus sp.]MEA4874347.1 hypothetical protein [Anaerorhabdus sp.]